MDREHGGLGSYACDRVRWLELADFLDREGITFRLDVNVPTETFSVDGGRSAVVIPDGEVEGDEWVARPVEQTNTQNHGGAPTPSTPTDPVFRKHIVPLRAGTA